MTARLLNEPADQPGRPSSLGIAAPDHGAESRPVLSVSPDVAAREAQRHSAESPPIDRRAFLTPRVIDQDTFDELATSLRGLVDESRAASSQLVAQLGEIRNLEGLSSDASVQLQERLRLGARMLKAFQTQISRVEAAVAEFDQRSSRLDTVQQRIDAALNSLESRANDVIDRARDRLEQTSSDGVQRLRAELEPMQQRLEATLHGLQDADTRARDLDQRVESSEVEMAALAARLGESNETVDRSLAAVAEAVGDCEETRGRLSDDLARAAGGIEQACQRGGGLAEELGAIIDRARAAGAGLDERLDRVAAAQRELDGIGSTCARLDGLLERLGPWRPLLLGPGRDGLPEPVARLVDDLKVGVTRDLGRLATTMRSVADRVDELSGGPRATTATSGRPELRITRQSSMMPDVITVVEGSSPPGPSDVRSSVAEGGQAV
ncbi:MAG: hypothetical protein ACYTGG_09900 [Planctomycetota bacterium]|jgi:predicted  nucleic acid-binding Zn-ribbon protein